MSSLGLRENNSGIYAQAYQMKKNLSHWVYLSVASLVELNLGRLKLPLPSGNISVWVGFQTVPALGFLKSFNLVF